MCLILDSGKYVVLNGVLQLIIYIKEKNAILFTYPPKVRFSFGSECNESAKLEVEFYLCLLADISVMLCEPYIFAVRDVIC